MGNNNGQEQNPRVNDPKKEDCPLCHISEETLRILKEKGKEKKENEKENK